MNAFQINLHPSHRLIIAAQILRIVLIIAIWLTAFPVFIAILLSGVVWGCGGLWINQYRENITTLFFHEDEWRLFEESPDLSHRSFLFHLLRQIKRVFLLGFLRGPENYRLPAAKNASAPRRVSLAGEIFVHPWLVVVEFIFEDESDDCNFFSRWSSRNKKTLIVLPDSADKTDFRRLRMALLFSQKNLKNI